MKKIFLLSFIAFLTGCVPCNSQTISFSYGFSTGCYQPQQYYQYQYVYCPPPIPPRPPVWVEYRYGYPPPCYAPPVVVNCPPAPVYSYGVYINNHYHKQQPPALFNSSKK